MTECSDQFNTRASTEEHRRLEGDDYDDAISGVDVGRMRKHIPNAATDPITGQKETAAARFARTLQWLLLNDDSYARAHRAALTSVNNAMDATAQALLDFEAALKQATADIEGILVKAARSPDGRKAFRDENGNIVDQDGNVISEALADGIMWRGDEPTYEEYLAQRQRIERLNDARNELLGIEAELGGQQNDLHNDENPPSPDELRDIEDRADELRDRVSAIQSEFGQEVEHKTNLDMASPAKGVELSEKSQTTMPTFGSSN